MCHGQTVFGFSLHQSFSFNKPELGVWVCEVLKRKAFWWFLVCSWLLGVFFISHHLVGMTMVFLAVPNDVTGIAELSSKVMDGLVVDLLLGNLW